MKRSKFSGNEEFDPDWHLVALVIALALLTLLCIPGCGVLHYFNTRGIG